MEKEVEQQFRTIISQIYPKDIDEIITEIDHLLTLPAKQKQPLSQKDNILVTYPDHVNDEDKTSLTILQNILKKDFPFLSTVHILPFHPESSDDGFAVSDYTTIKQSYGTWDDLEKISQTTNIMCDVILNHVSSKHNWFVKCQKGNSYYQKFFHIYKSIPYKPHIFRARTTPLFTPYIIDNNKQYAWTTFSADQIDINFEHYEPLIHYLRIIRNYYLHNITLFRLDAIAYIIKEETGVHQKKTFFILELLTLFVKSLNETNLVIPEVNFSMSNNKKYLEKSDAIYHFELPSLLLYTHYKQNSSVLNRWLDSLQYEKDKHLLQFTSTHDGIALLGAKKLLQEKEFEFLINSIEKKNGIIGYKKVGRTQTPYEANGLFQTFVENEDAYVSFKLLTLALKGIPLFYFPDFFTLTNWTSGYEETNQPRKLARQKFTIRQYELLQEFANKPYQKISHAIKIKNNEPIFHPNAEQKILFLSDKVISIKRFTKSEEILCLTNITAQNQTIKLDKKYTDILTSKIIAQKVTLKAYQTVWLK